MNNNNPTTDEIMERRRFLAQLAGAGITTLGMNEPRAFSAEKIEQPKATADCCILLWMGGGMAGPETFDPKRYTPYEVGVRSESILSTFPSIPTVVDGVRISQGLENVAKVMDRGTIVRSHRMPDLGTILHSRHQYHWHTGYVPPQTVGASFPLVA